MFKNNNIYSIQKVDAHADINTPQRSVSGNMHGMPVAFLMGLADNASKLPGFDWFKPCVGVNDVVYIGLRDLDQDEKDTIRRLGIKAYTVSRFLCVVCFSFSIYYCLLWFLSCVHFLHFRSHYI